MNSLRKKKYILLLIVLLFFSVNLPLLLTNNDKMQTDIAFNGQPYKEGEWIIKWDGHYPKQLEEEATIVDWLPEIHVTKVKFKDKSTESKWLSKWIHSPQIKYIQPNYTFKITQAPNDSYYSKQTYLQQIHAELGWDQVTNTDITIAVLDTGIDLSHPDLLPNLVKGINLLEKDKTPEDDNGHGTNVAGILAAVGNNSLGVTGLAWRAKIMPVKVMEHTGKGESYDVGLGIRYAVDNGAKIVLIAAGEAGLSPFLNEAIQYADENDVLVVAAAGNDWSDLSYPAAINTVLSVGAVDSVDEYAPYSNSGQQIDVVAPGESVYTTKPGGDYMMNSGTSMAAPQVAGLAALIMEKYPNLKPKQIIDLIKFTADDVDEKGWDIRTGYGRINVARALTSSLDILRDGYEPNNFSNSASMFPLEDRFNGELDYYDTDWYKLDLPYKGQLKLNLEIDQYLTEGVVLEVYSKDNLPIPDYSSLVDSITNNNGQDEDSNQTTQDNSKTIHDNESEASENKVNENQRVDEENNIETTKKFKTFQIRKKQTITLDLPKGETYIKLYVNSDEPLNYGEVISYTIENEYSIYQDEFENNDYPWNAYNLEHFPLDMRGTFNHNGDVDWYKLSFTKPGFLTVSVFVDTPKMDPVLIIQPFNKKGEDIDYQGTGKEEFGYISVTPGDYFIKVSDLYNYAVVGEYKLKINFKTIDGDNNEPNDASDQAKELSLSEKILNGSIYSLSDYDWFVFEIAEPTYISFDFGSDENMDIVLYDKTLNVIQSNQDILWKEAKVFDSGRYFLRLSSNKSNNKYTLQAMKYELDGNFIDIHNHWAKDVIVKLYQENLVFGYEDFTFRPDQSITKAEVAHLLDNDLHLVTGKQDALKDIKNSQYKQSIINVLSAGLMAADKDKNFNPDQPVSRKQIVQILAKAYGIPIKESTQVFVDVPEEHSAYDVINSFSDYGLLNGIIKDNKFLPDQELTRAEFAVLFNSVRNAHIQESGNDNQTKHSMETNEAKNNSRKPKSDEELKREMKKLIDKYLSK